MYGLKMDFNITIEVQRKNKKFSKLLSRIMIVFSVIFVLMGIIFDNSFFFPAFMLVLLYYFYNRNADRSYEYVFENESFTVDVIRGKRRRKNEQYLYYKDLEVVAPPDHELVRKYKKKGGTEKLKKYDYTSYEENTPYYTMIIKRNDEKIKLLLDLDEQTMRFLKLRYPQRVFLQ